LGLGSLDPDDTALVHETRYDFERANHLPERFVERFAETCSRAYDAWVKARANADFREFEPHLKRIVDLNREKAEHHGYSGSPYNALLEDYERGMTAEQLHHIFGQLAGPQSGLVERILRSPNQPDLAWLDQEWDEEKQWTFSLEVLKDLGYDFEAGRQDRSVHPFTTNFGLYDVRITTRTNPNELFSALTGSIHECGHALYRKKTGARCWRRRPRSACTSRNRGCGRT